MIDALRQLMLARVACLCIVEDVKALALQLGFAAACSTQLIYNLTYCKFGCHWQL
jgi:hypothetical protein